VSEARVELNRVLCEVARFLANEGEIFQQWADGAEELSLSSYDLELIQQGCNSIENNCEILREAVNDVEGERSP